MLVGMCRLGLASDRPVGATSEQIGFVRTMTSGTRTGFGSLTADGGGRDRLLVFLGQASDVTMRDVLRVCEVPMVFLHSSAGALRDHPRNIPDEVLAGLPANGGVAMVTLVPRLVLSEDVGWTLAADRQLRAHGFWLLVRTHVAADCRRALEAGRPPRAATLAPVADHLDHMREMAGIDHLGIGGDHDGTAAIQSDPDGVCGPPRLIAGLLLRRWSEADVAKFTWRNAVRVL
ncbi:membrane dipeptidase [Kitasatospora sp. NPDC057015]|uniref:membrane dipeptidase n=1 Tax=Kitasatospora sp. NPDC057015 TaxID=3346001 RepID=UPI003624E9A2